MTTDYSKWPLKAMSATNLFLDPENPRIPATGRRLSQRELIAELVEHDGVYELAKSIAENGYFPNEVIVTYVAKSDQKRYVVEGNRRVAAVKCLMSPDAAPDDFRGKFAKLAADVDSKSIAKIHVLTAPSRKAAIPLLLDRHTHQQIQSWSRPMQAQFLRRLRDDGMTIEQIAAWSRKTAADVRKLVTADLLYAAACSLDLDAATKAKVTNPRTFPLTTLERAFESKSVCDFLGVERDDSRLLKGKIKQSEFSKGFKKIVTDVATGDINTRNLNDANDIKTYLTTFGDAKPDLAQKGRFELQGLAKVAKGAAPTAKPSTAKKKTPRPSHSVIPAIIRCSCASKRINDVFNELKRLRVDKHPNASAVLLRTLIDLCVANYLEKAGEMKPLLAKHQSKGKPKDWAPSLHQMLHHLLEAVDCGLEGAAHTALQTFNTSRRNTLCLDGLDKFTHNKYLPPEPDELRNVWTTVEPLMEIVLVDPN